MFHEKFLNSTDVSDKTLYDPSDRRLGVLRSAGVGVPLLDYIFVDAIFTSTEQKVPTSC